LTGLDTIYEDGDTPGRLSRHCSLECSDIRKNMFDVIDTLCKLLSLEQILQSEVFKSQNTHISKKKKWECHDRYDKICQSNSRRVPLIALLNWTLSIRIFFLLFPSYV
jgi:hypothetical protein